METFEDNVVIDTCALVNARIADALLRLAQEGAHKVFWTQRIQQPTARVQLKNGWAPRIVDSFHARLTEVFPDALISGHEKWIEQCTNDEGDRHVLACAIEAKARYIVTFNTDDFKDADLARWNIRALKPNDYLVMLYERDTELLKECLVRAARKKRVPPRRLLEGLLRDCRSFAERLLSELSEKP